MSTLDHGLEVLRKSSEKYLGSNSESIIRTNNLSNPFSPPIATDYISRSVSGSVETFEYKSGGVGGTILKTVIITYQNSSLKDLVSVQVI